LSPEFGYIDVICHYIRTPIAVIFLLVTLWAGLIVCFKTRVDFGCSFIRENSQNYCHHSTFNADYAGDKIFKYFKILAYFNDFAYALV